MATTFAPDKVLDRPSGKVVTGPGSDRRVSGYRIHHGRVEASGEVPAWFVGDDGAVLGWHAGWVAGTTLHGLFEDDDFRTAMLGWVARRAGKHWTPSGACCALDGARRGYGAANSSCIFARPCFALEFVVVP